MFRERKRRCADYKIQLVSYAQNTEIKSLQPPYSKHCGEQDKENRVPCSQVVYSPMGETSKHKILRLQYDLVSLTTEMWKNTVSFSAVHKVAISLAWKMKKVHGGIPVLDLNLESRRGRGERVSAEAKNLSNKVKRRRGWEGGACIQNYGFSTLLFCS